MNALWQHVNVKSCKTFLFQLLCKFFTFLYPSISDIFVIFKFFMTLQYFHLFLMNFFLSEVFTACHYLLILFEELIKEGIILLGQEGWKYSEVNIDSSRMKMFTLKFYLCFKIVIISQQSWLLFFVFEYSLNCYPGNHSAQC